MKLICGYMRLKNTLQLMIKKNINHRFSQITHRSAQINPCYLWN